MATRPPDYPSEWESDVVLSDGGIAHLRPIVPDDADALVAFHAGLSDETRRLRFFSPHPTLLPAEVTRFTNVDYRDRLALVAELGDHLIAVARYDRLPGTNEAEVAFVVDDAHQGRGLGTILLEHLAAAGAGRGIERFVAQTLPHNRRMLGVFRDAGFAEETSWGDGVVNVAFAITPDATSVASAEERERRAAIRSIERLLRPRSVAVVGASREPGTIGHEVFRNLLAAGFQGPVYPVNPETEFVAGVRAFPTLGAIPDPVELVVVTVPAAAVEAVVEDCGAKGVAALIVITAGFAETGQAGLAAERRIVARAHAHGMRMIGPNCMGAINADPQVSMNATLAPAPPTAGRVAFASQSGGLGIAILDEAARRGLGVSSFVSMGNKADVSSNDLLRFWEQDPETDVILLYLESFGNPRAFSRIARRVSRAKPIVAVKGGRRAATPTGRSHTAALAAADVAVDALFAQTGVIRVDTLQELFEVAAVLRHQPLPAGHRVAIIGNAGGPGTVAADACEGAGLFVPRLPDATQAALVARLDGAPSVANPVELAPVATAAQYHDALVTVLADPSVDAALVAFVPPLVSAADDVAAAIARAAATSEKPVLASFLGWEGVPAALRTPERTIPSFRFPESAARALARAAGYAEWRRRPEGKVPTLDVDVDGARMGVAAALEASPAGCWLDAESAARLVGSYGIPLARGAVVHDADEAAARALQLGFPVALKAAAGELVHKAEAGGVHVGLRSAPDVRRAFTEMEAVLGARMGGALVQVMAEPGIELIAGVTQDPSFGPLVLFGAGGATAELVGDRAVRVLPVTDIDAMELVGGLRSSPLLFGYRGRPGVDVGALQDLLIRLGRLGEDLPEVAELDLNPVIAGADGVTAVDVKVRLAPVGPRPELALRRLRVP